VSKKQKTNTIIHKQIKFFILILFVLSIFFVSIISYIFSNTYDITKYDLRFERFGVYDRFIKEEALQKTQNIITFFKYESELDKDFFKYDEIIHLEEVRSILSVTNIVYHIFIFIVFTIIILLFFIAKKNSLSFFFDMLFYSGFFIVSTIILFMIIYSVFGFGFLFEKFHQVFFVNKYAFDPLVSNMKALFPDRLFYDIFKTILVNVFLEGILFLSLGCIGRNKKNKKIIFF
jgi:uncharacterized membrane protein